MIAPDHEFELKLTAADCNVLLSLLAEAPYRVAAPIVDRIRGQILAADPGAFDQPNGVDHAPDR